MVHSFIAYKKRACFFFLHFSYFSHPQAQPTNTSPYAINSRHHSIQERKKRKEKQFEMLKQIILFSALVLVSVHAWSFTVWKGPNQTGPYRHYFDFRAGNNCFTLSSDVAAQVNSFSFCSMGWTRCSLTIHSENGCTGAILGSATAAAPAGEWQKGQTSPAGRGMKSFRIQGCKGVPIIGEIDCQKCTHDP